MFSQPAWLVGEWSGVLGAGREVVGDRRPLPFDMAVDEDGRVFVRLDEQPWTILDGAELDEANAGGTWLRGNFQGDRRTVDTNRREYRMVLELRYYESNSEEECLDSLSPLLCGSCVALSTGADDEVKAGNALTDFVELRKKNV